MKKNKVVYLGNLPSIVQALQSAPGIELVAWLVDREDAENPAWSGSLAQLETLPIIYPVASTKDIDQALALIGTVDLGIIANFGVILTAPNLQHTKHGFINAHFGILPDYPGRTPVHDAIHKGERVVGVTLHQVILEVDAGPIVECRRIAVAPGDPSFQLTFQRLESLAREMILSFITKKPQDIS